MSFDILKAGSSEHRKDHRSVTEFLFTTETPSSQRFIISNSALRVLSASPRCDISELPFTTDIMAAEALVKIICLLARTASTTLPVKSNTRGRKDRAPSPFHN